MRLAVCGVLACVVLSGCATGGGTAGQGSPTRRSDLAEQAEVAAANLQQRPAGAHDGRARAGDHRAAGARQTRRAQPPSPAGPASDVDPAAAGSPSAGGRSSAATWEPVRLVADARGDHGNGPEYADLVSLSAEDDGTSLRLGIELAGTVPGRLAAGEVQGVGVDLFRSRDDESDFQVFLDGGSDGWRGFLQTPQGFVRYPGTIAVDGRMLVTVIPWSSLGGRDGAEVSAFADWSDGAGRSSADVVGRGPLRLR